ncbi:MAG: DUF1801 domain-containing protein [Chitinophagaceae bacterium]|nr:DUF1801 domain-containing protein [Chitinophagaceae bacterium]
MAKSKKDPTVDDFLGRADKWAEEFEKLRAIILDCPVTEELKWGQPCYTWQHHNIVLIHGFKEYCALLFFKGALMNDPEGILVQQSKNVQSARQVRFTHLREITKLAPVLKAYVYEAIEIEKAGLKVKLKESAEFEMAEEFRIRLNKNAKLKKAFEALTPGRQRGYLLYFSSAKQSKTRAERVEKYTKHILNGKGLNDD